MSVEISPAAQLRATLHALGEGVDAVAFGLPGPSLAARRREQEYVLWSINEYLLPRLGDLAPLFEEIAARDRLAEVLARLDEQTGQPAAG